MKLGMEMKKRGTRDELRKSGDRAIKSTEMQIRAMLDNLLNGNGGGALGLSLRERTRRILADWRMQWQCPKGYEDHVLLQDLNIPSALREKNLKAAAEVGMEPASDTEGDLDDGADDDDESD